MNVMRTKAAGIIAAVALAGAGTALLVGYVNGAENRALKGEKPADVYVVSDTIPKGTRAEEIAGKVRRETVPVKIKATGAVASLDSLTGQVAVVDLVPGEQVVTTRFATPATAAALDIPAGMLEVTVALDSVRAAGGLLREGDTVGVVASFDDDDEPTTHMILHKVRVTSVRTENGASVKKNQLGALTGKVIITMALDAPSVEKVIFAAEHGKLWLTSEPSEANESGTKVQTRASVNQ